MAVRLSDSVMDMIERQPTPLYSSHYNRENASKFVHGVKKERKQSFKKVNKIMAKPPVSLFMH